MKVIFLKVGEYSVDFSKIIEVTKDDVSNAREFELKNADYIEGYVNSGKALLPCMLNVMGAEYVNKEPLKDKESVSIKKTPGRKPKVRV